MSRLTVATLVMLAIGLGCTTFPVLANNETPSSAQAASFGACKETLNPNRRSVTRFKNGKVTLGYGRLIVTAAKYHSNRYCVEFDVGTREVIGAWGRNFYRSVHGVCRQQPGGMGAGPGPLRTWSKTVVVPQGGCVGEDFTIIVGDAEFRASYVRAHR